MIQPLNFVDRYSSSLSVSYTSGGTTLTVSSTTGLPAGNCCFYVIVRAESSNTEEVFLVSNVNTGSNILTVVGAQAGTSASNHTSGANIIGGIITSGASARMVGDILQESAKIGSGIINQQKKEATSLATSSSLTLFTYSSGPGFISDLYMSVTQSSVSDLNALTLTITTDGNTVFNDRASLFFAAEYQSNQSAFLSRYVGASNNNSNNVGYYSYIPIPFSSSITIVLNNTSGSNACTVSSTITAQTNVLNNWPYTRKLWCSSGTLTNQAVNTVETLVNATSLQQGRLLGVFLSMDATPNTASPATAPLEGNVKIYLDSAVTPNIETPGTPDYFHMSNYFQGFTAPYVSDYVGLTIKTANIFNAYRFHIQDPIHFNNALKITWNCGDSSQVNFTGGERLAYCVWYYTE
jgi:Protein of unknown function (DUF2961)